MIMLKTIIATTLGVFLSTSAALAVADPAPATKADPSDAGNPAEAFRTCIGNSLHEVDNVKEYESIRYVPGTFYVGSRLWLSTGSENLAGVTDCLKKAGTKKH